MATQIANVYSDRAKAVPTQPYRGTAIVAGVLLIVCTAASVLSMAPLGSMLDRPVDLTRLAANANLVVLTALIEFVWAASGAGIAIALYPVLRQHGPGLALGAVAARVVEGVLVLMGTLGLLAVLALAQKSAGPGLAGNAAGDATVQALLGARDWAVNFMGLLPFLLGAGLYYALMYRATLVPRWLSGWGLLGVALSVGATLYAGFTQDLGFSTLGTVLNAPIGLQELALAVWLIVKGFNPAPKVAPAESRA